MSHFFSQHKLDTPSAAATGNSAMNFNAGSENDEAVCENVIRTRGSFLILIIGVSHTRIMSLWQETLPADTSGRDYKIAMVGIGRTFLKKFYIEHTNKVTFRSPKRRTILNDLIGKPALDKQNNTLFLSLGFHGVYLYNSSLWNDFTLSHDDKNRHYISDAAFTQMVIRFNYHILGFIKSLRNIGITPAVIAAPFLPQKFIEISKVKSLTPSELQLVQTRYRAVFGNVLQAKKIPVLAPLPRP